MNVADIRDAVKAVVEAHATWNNWYSIWSPAKDRASELTYPAAVWGPWRARMVEDEAGAVRRVVQCTLLVVDAVSTERTTDERDATAEAAEDAASDFILKLRQDYGRSLTVENVQVSTVHDEGTVLETGVILSFTVNVDGVICLDGDEFNPPTNCPTFEELVAGLTWTEIKADLSPEQIAAAEADLCDGGGPCDPATINTTDGSQQVAQVAAGASYNLPQSHIKYYETNGIAVNALEEVNTQLEEVESHLYPDIIIPSRQIVNSLGDPASSSKVTLRDLVDGFGPFQMALNGTVRLNNVIIGSVPSNATGNFDVLNSADAPVGSLDVDKWRIADGAVQLKDSAGNDIGTSTAVPAEGSVNVTAPDAAVQLKDSAGNNIGSPDSYRSNSSNNKTAPDGSVQRRDSAGTAIGSPIAVRSNQTGLDVTCPDGTVNVVDNNGDPLTSTTVRSNGTATAVVTDWEGEFPAITGNTPSYNDEGDSTTGWTNTGATLTTASSVLRFTMTTAGVGATVNRTITQPVTNKDWVLYGKVRAGFTSVGSQVLALRGAGLLAIDLRWNFNTVTNVQATGTLSMRYTNAAGTTTNLVLKTGGSFSSNWTDFALQYDSLNQKFAVHERDANGWAFLGHIEGSFAITTLEVRLGSAAGVSHLEWDFLTLVAPNIQSIGDSLTRGSTLFSPIVSMGLNNGDSQWQRWARLYPSLRNNLIINKGIGGNTTAMVAARIQADVLDNLPKLVMLSVCNNDYSAPINLADRTTNIQNSINLCGVAGVPVIIYNATYGTPDEARQPNHRLFYLEWWNDYRPTLTGVQGSINIMGGLREPGGYADNLLTQTDGIHPNVTGYGRMGRWIEALPYA